jgi:GlcNAc-P-P-Und epimerase
MNILVTGGSGFIGTNYIEYLLELKGINILNLDKEQPRNPDHMKYWKKCDLLDVLAVNFIVSEFAPTHVVHLAAETGVDKKLLKDFATNIDGVENLISALSKIDTIQRVIFTSSLLVCKMGYVPDHDTDYQPSTAYGESKVEGEKIVRNAQIDSFRWTIIRPISIWGPWFKEPYKNFFKAISQGWYFHIGDGHYFRSLGYVKNICHQIHMILNVEANMVNKKTFYVADYKPSDLHDMSELIRESVSARNIRSLPVFLMKITAWVGDLVKAIGWTSFPISSFRLKNIRTEYIFDLSSIEKITGPLRYDLRAGVEETISWMKDNNEL